MKISLAWLRTLIDTGDSPEQLADLLTNTGLEVEHLDEIETIRGGLRGLVVGEVLQCRPHPNADKLTICEVNYNSGELVQIVCGAPNVRPGQKVVVAPVNTTIYPTNGEAFTIKKAKIRGESSMGMICAEDEIGLSSDHAGILVLDPSAEVGSSVADHFAVQSDYCIEIGLTPNRGDAISHLGVARDVHAVTGNPIRLPKIWEGDFNGNTPFQVHVEDPELCPRYAGAVLRNIGVQASPDWLQARLRAIGLKPINNVVDVTNFVMHEIGQPIHAFDLNHIRGGIVVRKARPGEELITLDEVKRSFKGEELVIADAEKILAIAGVFGGHDSGVSPSTTSIFIESATFNPGSVRRTARQFGLNTDASFRYERGTDPEIPVFALQRVVQLLNELCAAQPDSDLIDVYPVPVRPASFELNTNWLNAFCGTEAEPMEIKSILERLDMEVSGDGESFQLEIPAYRVDVKRPVDVAEEFLRIYGYNRVDIPEIVRMTPSASGAFSETQLRNKLANNLSAIGFLEIMNNSQTRLDLTEEARVQILNPLSQEYAAMRTSLLPGMLDALSYNWKRRNGNLMLYEFGKTYFSTETGYSEREELLISGSGDLRESNWQGNGGTFDYFYLKSIVNALWRQSGLSGDAPENLVEYGNVPKGKLRELDIDAPVPYARIDWTGWVRKARKARFNLEDIPKFPVVKRDISAVLDRSVLFSAVAETVRKQSGRYYRDINCFDVYQGDKLEPGKKAYAFSVYWYDDQKTMNDAQIDQLLRKTIEALERDLSAVIRR